MLPLQQLDHPLRLERAHEPVLPTLDRSNQLQCPNMLYAMSFASSTYNSKSQAWVEEPGCISREAATGRQHDSHLAQTLHHDRKHESL